MGLERKNVSHGNRKQFARKPYGKYLYKWTPFEDTKKKKKAPEQTFFCNAKPNTNGEDFITTYSYNQINDNGKIKRFAYVECDYVQ